MALTTTTTLAMTDQQRQQFDDRGFILIENFFTPTEFDGLQAAIDEVAGRIRVEKGLTARDPFALRNALSHHDAFLDLIDHPRMLPLVVDAIGWNIQIRTTNLDYRPPYPQGLDAGELGTGAGADPLWEPSSRYWLIKDSDDVPLKAWADERSGDADQSTEKVHI